MDAVTEIEQPCEVRVTRAQAQFMRSTARYAWLCGGLGSGKTHVLALWLIAALCEMPRGLGLLGAQNPANMNIVVRAKVTQLLDEMGIGYVFGRQPLYASRFRSHEGIISLENGAQCACVSMHESGAIRTLRGMELSHIALDETREMSQEVFDVAIGRLRGPGPQRLRMSSTPNGHDWQWRKFVSDERLKDAEWFHATSRENPHLPPGYVESLESGYAKEFAAQELDAQFVDIGSGQIFRFVREKHVRPLQLDESLPLAFTCDFNVAPLCGLAVQYNRSTREVFVLREFVIRTNGQTRALCEMFLEAYPWHRQGYEFLGDEAGAARSTRGTESDIDIMRAAFRTRNGRCLNVGHSPGIAESVNAVNALLEPAVGDSRLAVDPSCRYLIRDLAQMSWRDGVDGRKPDKSDSELTHAADALRYLVHRVLPVRGGPVLSGRDLNA